MATVRFTYDGKFGRAARGSGAIVTRELNELGKDMSGWIRANTKIDTGESRKKTVYYVTGRSTQQTLHVEGQAPQALYSQQTGRKAGGKQPPPELMLALVRRKGLRLDRTRRAARNIRQRKTVKGRLSAKAAGILARRRAKIAARVAS